MAQPVPLRLKLPYATEEEFLAKLGPTISAGSMFVATRTPKPEGSLLAFEFVLSNGQRILAGEGKITSVSRDASRPGMTLTFKVLDAASQELIARATGARKTRPPMPLDPAAQERLRRRQAILDGPAPMQAVQTSPILGIDLGTTICRCAVWQAGEVKLLPLEGQKTTLPSFVAFDDRGRQLVGTRAKAQLLIDPKSAIFGSKRLIGRRGSARKIREMSQRFPYEICADAHGDACVKVQGKPFTIPQITSFLLTEIRNRASDALGVPARRAVIGVPAYFNDRQRQGVREAGKLAGLDVQRVLNEPTAVAIAYGFGKGLTRKRLMVYDLGGGTFDASILEATGDDFEVVGAGGDNFLGGLDFDARIATWLEERFKQIQQFPLPTDPHTRQRVRDAAENAKITLSEKADARVHLAFVATRNNVPVDLDIAFDRGRFESLTRDLIERSLTVTRAVFEASGLEPASIDEVLLVGGQSQSQGVREALEQYLGRSARRDVDPLASVAIGAALVGRAIHSEKDQTGTFTLSYEEMLSSAIGIARPGGAFERILERGTRLPCEKAANFVADASGQLRVAVYQGDAKDVGECEFLGKLVLALPPGRNSEVVFEVTADGILTVSAPGPDNTRYGLSFATTDITDEAREVLAEANAEQVAADAAVAAESAEPELPEEKKGLLSRLFGRK